VLSRFSKLTPNCSEDTGSEPDVTRLGSQVPSGTVEHVRVDDVDDQSTDVVQVSGENDGLGSETGRSDLGDERVTDGSDGEIVKSGKEDEDGTGRIVLAVALGLDRSQDTGDQHQDVQSGGTPEVDGPSSGELHEPPRRDGTEGSDGEHDQVEGRGGGLAETGLLQEVGGVTHERTNNWRIRQYRSLAKRSRSRLTFHRVAGPTRRYRQSRFVASWFP
jgi:hypothetical protein